MNIDHFLRLACGEGTSTYIGCLPGQLHLAIGASSNAVFITAETLRKQMAHHGDFPIEFFEFLPWMMDNGEPIFDARPNVLHLVSDCSDLLGHRGKVTVKATRGGHLILVTSVHALRTRDFRRMKRKAPPAFA